MAYYHSIREAAEFIARHHEWFASEAADVNAVEAVLVDADEQLSKYKMVVGITYEAHTFPDYGNLDTWVTIAQVDDNGSRAWEITERTRPSAGV